MLSVTAAVCHRQPSFCAKNGGTYLQPTVGVALSNLDWREASYVFFPEMTNCEAADLNYNLRLREGTLHSGPPRIQELQIHAEIGADDQICFGSPCMCAGSAKSFGNSSEQSKVPWPLAPYMFSSHSLGLFPIRHLSSNSVERWAPTS